MQNPKLKIYFHPSEKYFPSSFDYFVQNSQLISGSQNLGTQLQQDLPNIVCPPDVKTYLKAKESIRGGVRSLDPSQIPIYYFDRTYGDLNYRTFILFYPYNGDYNLILARLGQHWGDIERFTIEYTQNGDITRIYFGAHGDKDGRWVNDSDLQREDGHIVLYVAKNVHGFYPRSGIYFRFLGFANDVTGRGGKIFIPQLFLNIPVDKNLADLSKVGLAWFCGKIGEDGIDSVAYKGWYYKMEISENPPPPVNSRLYYTLVSLISFGLLYTIFIGGVVAYKKSGSKLFIIVYILLLLLIILYIRKTLQNIET